MKKLMFAAAALTAGFAMAGDAITSANVVGFAGNGLDTGYGCTLLTPQFFGLGAESIPLDSLVPKSEEDTEWNVEIQCLDNAGRTISDQDYIWVGGKWTVSGEAITTPVTFAPGQGLCVFCYMGEVPATLQSSGEVGQKDVSVALDTGYGCILTGNPFPTAVSLDDIVPYTDGEGDLDWNVEIQCLDNAGRTISDQDYIWVGGKWTVSGEEITTPVTFAPGQGLCIFCYMGEEQTYLRITAPELK